MSVPPVRAARFLWLDLRLEKPWRYKAPFLLLVLYLHAAQGSLSFGRSIEALLASFVTIVGIAGVAYLSNDFADREADRKAGKPNAAALLNNTQTFLLAAALLIAALLPWAIVLPFDQTSAILLVIEFGLIGAYALPPVRLKERGLPGVLADALYAHAVPAILASVTYRAMADGPIPDAWRFITPLALWQFSLGVRNVVLHQLADHENDVRAGTRTWVVRCGVDKARRLLRRVFIPFEFGGFAVFVASTTSPGVIALAFLARALLVRRSQRSVPLRSLDSRAALYVYVDPFYLQWLPVLVALLAIRRDPAFLAVVVLHVALFNDWWRQRSG